MRFIEKTDRKLQVFVSNGSVKPSALNEASSYLG